MADVCAACRHSRWEGFQVFCFERFEAFKPTRRACELFVDHLTKDKPTPEERDGNETPQPVRPE